MTVAYQEELAALTEVTWHGSLDCSAEHSRAWPLFPDFIWYNSGTVPRVGGLPGHKPIMSWM